MDKKKGYPNSQLLESNVVAWSLVWLQQESAQEAFLL